VDWFWHVLLVCLVVIPVAIMWFAIAYELFTRRDLRWWQRGGWLIAILVFPLLGSLVYLAYTWLTAGRRRTTTPAPAGAAVPAGARHASPIPDSDTDLASLDRLRRNGVLSDAEFDAGKRRVLQGVTTQPAPAPSPPAVPAAATDREPKHGAP
jgi:hypothetical protein